MQGGGSQQNSKDYILTDQPIVLPVGPLTIQQCNSAFQNYVYNSGRRINFVVWHCPDSTHYDVRVETYGSRFLMLSSHYSEPQSGDVLLIRSLNNGPECRVMALYRPLDSTTSGTTPLVICLSPQNSPIPSGISDTTFMLVN